MVFKLNLFIHFFAVILFVGCSKEENEIKRIPFPYILEHAFDSLTSTKYYFESNLGRNDVAITAVNIDKEGIIWSEHFDKDGCVEIANVKMLSYYSSLYNFEFSISLTTDRLGRGKIFVNPDLISPYYKRLVFLDSENFLEGDTCFLYMDSSLRAYNLFDYKEQDKYAKEIANYKVLKSLDINGKTIENCVELTFKEHPSPTPNSIRKLWFSFDWGVVKFITKSDEEWSITNLH
jgi:hypothetical protein